MKNRATAQRTASEKDAEKWTVSPRFFTRFPNSHLSPVSERLEQASKEMETRAEREAPWEGETPDTTASTVPHRNLFLH